jgi:hypothetical protein
VIFSQTLCEIRLGLDTPPDRFFAHKIFDAAPL